METTEFLNRIIEVLRYVNSQTITGEGKIQLTQEQFDQINQAQDVETMQGLPACVQCTTIYSAVGCRWYTINRFFR